tara:strand:- start:871 stop:1563 length:693 start_codon:yes stop_codon:yes gene_type:complete
MLISEIFYSLQGEGGLTGVPSAFIRTAGCNLRCGWCDTPYASWESEGAEMSLDNILGKVQEHRASHCVITGGEPMIAKEIGGLCERLRQLKKHLTIETAGTVFPGNIACDLASISPKLSNSVPSEERAGPWKNRHEKVRLQPEVIRAWVKQYEYQFKFVVTSANDLDEIKTLLREIKHPIPSEKVMLMAEGVDSQTIRGRDQTLIEICKQEGYRYCNRLQIELFGDARGT